MSNRHYRKPSSSHVKYISSHPSSTATSTTRDQNNPDEKTIDLSGVQSGSGSKGKTGVCEGCGQRDAPRRFITHEFLCPSCRTDLRYKLITKTTVLNVYKGLTADILKEAVKSQTIRCYKTKNWHNAQSPPIRLFYEREIMDLAKRTAQPSRSQSRDQSSSRHHSRDHRSRNESSSHRSHPNPTSIPVTTLQVEKI